MSDAAPCVVAAAAFDTATAAAVPLCLLGFVCSQVDYYLALQAGKFIGNSVSTFSAFVILERQWQDRWVGRRVPQCLST